MDPAVAFEVEVGVDRELLLGDLRFATSADLTSIFPPALTSSSSSSSVGSTIEVEAETTSSVFATSEDDISEDDISDWTKDGY